MKMNMADEVMALLFINDTTSNVRFRTADYRPKTVTRPWFPVLAG
jgi:hypothetical protein